MEKTTEKQYMHANEMVVTTEEMIKDMMDRLEQKNLEYLIEIHQALDLAHSQQNWDLVEFCMNNLEEFMNTALFRFAIEE